MLSLSTRFRSAPRYVAVTLAGLTFAFGVSQALTLETRYLIAFFVGVVLLSLGMSLLGSIRDLLLYVLAFNLPFTSVEKAFLLTDEPTYVVSAIAVGLTELCLISLYAGWFANVFILKKERFPKLTKLDWWVLAFLVAHIISMVNTSSSTLTLYEIVRLGKYVLIYFYLAHQVRPRHLKWIVAGILFAIVLESALGIVQQRTGALLGVGRTKGASELQYEQGTVPGFEDVRRAEGTTFDPHTLGLFFAMTLPVPLVLALTPQLSMRYRFAATIALILGASGLAITFARASWMAFGGASLFVIWCLARWKQWRSIILASIIVVFLTGFATVPFAGWIHQRLFQAPPELVTTRFETLRMAAEIWRNSPWTGCGANGYLAAMEKTFSIFEGDPYFVPAHNMMLLIMTELGVIGVAVFLGLSGAVIQTGWKVTQATDPLLRSLGGALLGGFFALQIEGVTDPIYITNVTYFLLWFELGVSAALYAMCRTPDALSASTIRIARPEGEPALEKAGQS
jgi:putative inorganic carbon (hco3(-)) transporter